ncbi:MAG: hypothetical protein HZC01_04230 [Candidatus Kerfeldbacteria bacterium]|nr:hypothetical protein [Candidatus Kerfeldbacteria bacterium]
MSLKKYLIIMTTATLVSWIAWLFVFFFINPNEAGFVGFGLFYLSMLCALVGTFSLFGFFVRVWFTKEQVIFRHLGVATRQSFFFSILIIGTLMLQGARMLQWWTVLLLILFLTIMEFFFISRAAPRRN